MTGKVTVTVKKNAVTRGCETFEPNFEGSIKVETGVPGDLAGSLEAGLVDVVPGRSEDGCLNSWSGPALNWTCEKGCSVDRWTCKKGCSVNRWIGVVASILQGWGYRTLTATKEPPLDGTLVLEFTRQQEKRKREEEGDKREQERGRKTEGKGSNKGEIYGRGFDGKGKGKGKGSDKGKDSSTAFDVKKVRAAREAEDEKASEEARKVNTLDETMPGADGFGSTCVAEKVCVTPVTSKRAREELQTPRKGSHAASNNGQGEVAALHSNIAILESNPQSGKHAQKEVDKIVDQAEKEAEEEKALLKKENASLAARIHLLSAKSRELQTLTDTWQVRAEFAESITNTHHIHRLHFEIMGVSMLPAFPTLEAQYKRFWENLPPDLRIQWRSQRYVYHSADDPTVQLIANQGLRPSHCRMCRGHDPYTAHDSGFFGVHTKGVYLSKHADYTFWYSQKRVPVAGQMGKTVVFKLVTGRIKHFDSMPDAIPPDTNYDCHESGNNLEYYIFDSETMAEPPRPCFRAIPIAVVSWKAVESRAGIVHET